MRGDDYENAGKRELKKHSGNYYEGIFTGNEMNETNGNGGALNSAIFLLFFDRKLVYNTIC